MCMLCPISVLLSTVSIIHDVSWMSALSCVYLWWLYAFESFCHNHLTNTDIPGPDVQHFGSTFAPEFVTEGLQ